MSLGLLGSVLAAFALLLALASSALASRTYDSQITQANSVAFTTPYGLTVDGSDNLWVSDTGSFIVSKFDSSGTYLAQNDGTGIWNGSQYNQDLAFGSTAGLIYAVDSNADDLWGLNLDATNASVDLNNGLGSGCCFLRADVDNSGNANDGDVYVTNGSANPATVTRIDGSNAASNFSAAESYITDNKITATPDHAFGTLAGVAVGPDGDVYVADAGNGEVDRFDSTGTFVQAYTGTFGSISAIAVDPSTGNILIGDSAQGVVHELDSSGADLGDTDGTGTPAGSFNPQGLAVDSTGTLYVSDSAHPVVDVFGTSGPPPVTHDITVSATGLGTGTVTSTPAGISCGATCLHGFTENSTVTFTATPAAHSAFTGWTVDGDTNACPGTGTCDVPVGTVDHTVVANFDPIPQQTLDVSASGAGSGTITSSPAGIDCGLTCSSGFDENSTVTLTATPDAHNAFTGWTVDGDTNVCPGTGTCDVTIGTADHTAVANFEPIPQHTVDVTVTGAGSVSGDSGDISACTEVGGTCTGSYDEGSTLTLTATPDAHHSFTGWSGGGCTGTGDCVVSVTADASVTATFAVITRTLTVSKGSSTGAGSVTSSPGAIACGATCSDTFDEGSSVTITATPATGSTFTGWSGGGCSGSGACNVTVNANTTVTATFAQTKPTVVTTAGATGITQTAATVAGTVNPNSGNVTTCKFQYGTTTSYGSEAACSPAPGSGASAVGVSAALSGLAAGTTYHFRVVAINAGGTTNGTDQTFATLADTCATNAALCPPPPPAPTCATDPSLCPPPPPPVTTPGVLKLDATTATVTGGKAAVKLSCKGDTACSDSLKLTIKVKVRKGKRTVTTTVTIGKANVDIAAGGSTTVKVKLNRTAKQLLADKPSLKATLTGSDLKKTITLKVKPKKK